MLAELVWAESAAVTAGEGEDDEGLSAYHRRLDLGEETPRGPGGPDQTGAGREAAGLAFGRPARATWPGPGGRASCGRERTSIAAALRSPGPVREHRR